MLTGSDEWRVHTQQRIRDAFALFDKEKNQSVVLEEVPTMIRFLGVFPTEKALVLEILPDMQGGEPTGFVQYSRFEAKMLELLMSKQWEMDPSDVLMQAFRTLDPENKGYIEAEFLEELLTNRGTPFRPAEVEGKQKLSLFVLDFQSTQACMNKTAFMEVAKDGDTGRIYYEDYVALLSSIATS